VDYYARQRMWDHVLQKAPRLRSYNKSTISCINRALFHTGRLPYDMFSFPQIRGLDPLSPRHEGPEWYMNLSAVFLELGHVNYAEKWAHEALEIKGDRPWVLQRLVIINVAKGRVQVARALAALLQKNLLYRRWAERLMHDLDEDPTLSADQELGRIRSLMFTTDYPSVYLVSEGILQQLLRENKRNRMAFEYLMAYYLLTMELEEFVQTLPHTNEFNYPDLPRHYQEAVLLYSTLFPGRNAVLPKDLSVSSSTLRRDQDFRKALQRYSGDLTAARAGLAKDFGDTYWYYYCFAQTGAVSLASEAVRQ